MNLNMDVKHWIIVKNLIRFVQSPNKYLVRNIKITKSRMVHINLMGFNIFSLSLILYFKIRLIWTSKSLQAHHWSLWKFHSNISLPNTGAKHNHVWFRWWVFNLDHNMNHFPFSHLFIYPIIYISVSCFNMNHKLPYTDI